MTVAFGLDFDAIQFAVATLLVEATACHLTANGLFASLAGHCLLLRFIRAVLSRVRRLSSIHSVMTSVDGGDCTVAKPWSRLFPSRLTVLLLCAGMNGLCGGKTGKFLIYSFSNVLFTGGMAATTIQMRVSTLR